MCAGGKRFIPSPVKFAATNGAAAEDEDDQVNSNIY